MRRKVHSFLMKLCEEVTSGNMMTGLAIKLVKGRYIATSVCH